MKILGIETSCDESAVCLIDAEGGPPAGGWNDFRFQVLGNSLISQVAIHAQYGGVFPNLAKREHAKNLVPLLEQVLDEAKVGSDKYIDISIYSDKLREILAREPELYTQLLDFFSKNTKHEHSNILENVGMLQKPEIDAIAVTVGPGLEPALWVGINFARALSLVWSAPPTGGRRIPIVAVNHMEGHIVSALISDTAEQRRTHPGTTALRAGYGAGADYRGRKFTLSEVAFPLLALLISGGHTELVLSTKWHDYKIIGATRDDAVGEAFDKVARLLGLPYPGGPQISALAEMSRMNADKNATQMNADKNLRKSASPLRQSAISLPRPMIHSDNFDFSFAGLKTAVRRLIESKGLTLPRSDLEIPLRSDLVSDRDAFRMQIAREFEDAVTDVLVAKTMKVVEEYGVQTVVISGGVSANKYICNRLAEALTSAGLPPPLVPPPGLSTDNALMIALAGYFRAIKNEFADPATIRANGNLRLENKKMVSYPPSNEKR